MSSWTQGEVDKLKTENGGGNDNAKKIWLAKKTCEKYKPQEGDNLDKFKDFIRMAYEEKKFYKKPKKEEEEDDDDVIAEASGNKNDEEMAPPSGDEYNKFFLYLIEKKKK